MQRRVEAVNCLFKILQAFIQASRWPGKVSRSGATDFAKKQRDGVEDDGQSDQEDKDAPIVQRDPHFDKGLQISWKVRMHYNQPYIVRPLLPAHRIVLEKDCYWR